MNSLQLPYSIQITKSAPLDIYYGPYATVEDAIIAVPSGVRYSGLTVYIQGISEYWWTSDLSDGGILPKISGITGITGISAGGDLSGFFPNPTLKPIGMAGVWGSSTQVPEFTTDNNGRVIGVTGVNIYYPVTSFEGRTGPISLLSSDIATAIGYTPYSSTNPSSFISKYDTIISGDLTGIYQNPTVQWANSYSSLDSRYVINTTQIVTNGGNSFASTLIIGTTDNNSVRFILNGTNYLSLYGAGTFGSFNGKWNFAQDGSAIFSNNNFVLNASGIVTTGIWQGTAISDSYISSASNWNSKQNSLIPTSVQTSDYNANIGDFVLCDNSSGSFTVTLPSAPVNGSIIGTKIINNDSSNNIIIQASGTDVFNITGGPTTLELDLLYQDVILQYQVSTGLWIVTSEDLNLYQLDARYPNVNANNTFGGNITFDGTTYFENGLILENSGITVNNSNTSSAFTSTGSLTLTNQNLGNINPNSISTTLIASSISQGLYGTLFNSSFQNGTGLNTATITNAGTGLSNGVFTANITNNSGNGQSATARILISGGSVIAILIQNQGTGFSINDTFNTSASGSAVFTVSTIGYKNIAYSTVNFSGFPIYLAPVSTPSTLVSGQIWNSNSTLYSYINGTTWQLNFYNPSLVWTGNNQNKSGAVFNPTQSTGTGLITATITNAGSGLNGTYTGQGLVTMSGIGSGAVATVVVSGNIATSITITTQGIGYQIGDTLTISISNLKGALFTVATIGFSGGTFSSAEFDGAPILFGSITTPATLTNGQVWSASNHLYTYLGGVQYQLDAPTVVGTLPLINFASGNQATGNSGDMFYTGVRLNFVNNGLIEQELLQSQQTRVTSSYNYSSNSLTGITGLTTNVAAGKTYRFRSLLDVTADVTGGAKFGITGSCTSTNLYYWVTYTDGNTNTNTIVSRQTSFGSTGQSGTTIGKCVMEGMITVNTSGTLYTQFAQNVTHNISNVNIGSEFVIIQIQ